MQDRPSAIELLEAAAQFIEREIVPNTEGQRQFQSRVVANVMRIVAREIQSGETMMRDEVDELARLLGEPKPHLHSSGDVRDAGIRMMEKLSERIRAGDADAGPFREQVMQLTRRLVEDKLKIDNPRFLEADHKLRTRK